ncbi:MAG: TIGR02147 family protein [Bdellovibrionales bacterium]
MQKALYEHTDYKKVLLEFTKSQGKGARIELAKIAQCQPGYISQVLGGDAHISLEQADRIALHMGLDSIKHKYFINLVLLARAGTESLKKYLENEIELLRSEQLQLKNRFNPDFVLSVTEQSTFYSSWHYAAILTCISIEGLSTEAALSKKIHIPLKKVNEIIQFMLGTNLIIKDEYGTLKIGKSQIFLGADSPLISKHHTNWRMKAITALDNYQEPHLHYSGVIGVNSRDLLHIREIMTRAIEEIRKIVRESAPEEKCYCYNLDFFEV